MKRGSRNMKEAMKLVKYERKSATNVDLSFMSLAAANKVRNFHKSFPMYQPTPLAHLSSTAKALGLGDVYVKDESYRFGLNAFKVLGGSFAMGNYVANRLGVTIDALPYHKLISPEVKVALGDLTFVTATDGNHGRGVAWTARQFQMNAVVYMPKGSAAERLNNIRAEGADNLTIDGFTLTCVRSTAAVVSGNGCVLKNLTVTNAADHGIAVTGANNLVENCDISHTGRGGIFLTGGDRTTLTSANNRAVNNYIHDFSEVFQTYQPGIQLNGVGNVCAHNEIANSPHMAIGYSGNDHLIEYNNIHDVVLHSSDAGAIYAGFDWCAHGTVIRYNLLRDIGANGFTPDGIYWDDGHSGQTAYGNILINVKKFSFLIGGGRDNIVKDNIIFGDTRNPIHYDDRNRDGFVNGGWAAQATNSPDAPHWVKLRAIPYTNEYWKARFPQLSRLITDITTDPDDPDFPINPVGSVISGNIIAAPSIGHIAESVYRYSTVENNTIVSSIEEIGLDPEILEFKTQPKDFPVIPVGEIGRK